MYKTFLFAVIIIALVCVSTNATIINVPGDYPTIQEGVNACSHGDTVIVAPGTYYENVVIYQSISLIGTNRDCTIIDGSEEGDVVTIGYEVDSVFISGFTIRNSGDEELDAGLELNTADNCTIDFCKFNDNNSGLYLHASCYNLITRCYFSSNNNGIFFWEFYPAPLGNNQSNVISNNIIHNNNNHGILFEHMMYYHQSNVIIGNSISNNTTGISMITSEENEIYYNDLISNSGYGISLSMCMCGGMYNKLHHNNFLSNNEDSVQASDYGSGIDYWYSLTAEEGNYWSDYTGPDNNGDGIGDVPYDIDGDESQDLYPLMEPLYAVIEGVVTNEMSEPIEGAYVLAVGTPVDDSTNSNGGYGLDTLGAGMWDILFLHPSYRDTIVSGLATTPGHTTMLNVIMSISTDIEERIVPVPSNFTLFQNYPNPFNAMTVIRYSLPEPSYITIETFDILGRRVETLVQGEQPAGYHQAVWDTGDRSSGIYFCRIKVGDHIQSRKMVLIK